MATSVLTKPAAKGGSFLLESPAPQDIFTPADLTDDQKLIGQTAEEFVIKEVFPHVKDLEAKKPGLMPELTRKAAALGLMSGGTPEQYGGAGLDKISTTVLAEKFSVYAALPSRTAGTPASERFPSFISARKSRRKNICRRSPPANSSRATASPSRRLAPTRRIRSHARGTSPDGKHCILNGQKMWITNGGFADVYIVFAKVDGEKFTCFIVERGYPGLQPGTEEKKMGIHGSSTTPIFFENCPVPKENLLHEIGRGHIVAFNTLNVGRFTLGASCAGRRERSAETASSNIPRSARRSANRSASSA